MVETAYQTEATIRISMLSQMTISLRSQSIDLDTFLCLMMLILADNHIEIYGGNVWFAFELRLKNSGERKKKTSPTRLVFFFEEITKFPYFFFFPIFPPNCSPFTRTISILTPSIRSPLPRWVSQWRSSRCDRVVNLLSFFFTVVS